MKPDEYINDLFEKDDRIALVLVPRKKGARTQQRVWTASKAASDPVQRWLRHENAHGSDVYVSMNPLHSRARGRTKQDVAAVRRVYLDLDEDGPAKLGRVLQDGFDRKLPMPSYIVNSSKNRYQVIWNVKQDSLSTAEAEKLMRGLVREYGGDPAATDVSRVLRLPGFKHRGRGDWITMSATHEAAAPLEVWPKQLFEERRPVDPDIDNLRKANVRCEPGAEGGWDCTEVSQNEYLGNFESPAQAAETLMGTSVTKKRSAPSRSSGGDTSASGRDWARTRDGLRRGESPAAIEKELATKRADKRNPSNYAKRTVARAVASLAMER